MNYLVADLPTDALPASFLTTHRRSRQALFQTKSSDSTAFISPQTSRILANDDTSLTSTSTLSSSVLSSPEPARALSGAFSLSTPSPRTSLAIVQKMRERGSLTDPARTRRREPFGSFSVRIQAVSVQLRLTLLNIGGNTV